MGVAVQYRRGYEKGDGTTGSGEDRLDLAMPLRLEVGLLVETAISSTIGLMFSHSFTY